MYRDCKMNVNNLSKKVVLELTTVCNLRCSHCFYRKNKSFSISGHMKKNIAIKLIDKFKENNIDKLVFTGGEPTLHPDFIEIAEYAKKNIKKITLCTNGVIKSKKLSNKVIDLNFDTYTVSIDSHIEDIHDEFRGKKGALKKVVNFTRSLKNHNKHVSVHIALNLKNIDKIEKTVDFCKKFNCEVVIGSIYYDKLNLDEYIINNYLAVVDGVRKKYLKDKSVTLVGFTKYCNSNKCLDQKQVFTINRFGDLVDCYWKNGGGGIIKNY